MKSDICPKADEDNGAFNNLLNIDQLTGYPHIYQNSQDNQQQLVAKSDISVSPPPKQHNFHHNTASFASRLEQPSHLKSKSLLSLGSRHFSKGDI